MLLSSNSFYLISHELVKVAMTTFFLHLFGAQVKKIMFTEGHECQSRLDLRVSNFYRTGLDLLLGKDRIGLVII